jgi:heat-inducible transcriptional repressor
VLSERQQRILKLVVDAYLESGKPIGSAAVAEDPVVEWGASTVRGELAALEREGYLTHPHTSAGRVPTDSGYRFYADALLVSGAKPGAPAATLDLSQMRREIEEALRETASTLSRMTDLLAVATAPPPSAARVHRVEALQLQPGVVMVVVIASNGAVTKRVFNFERAVDPGLVEWASSFLNERLSGLALGARMAGDRLDDPELGPAERGFLDEIRDAFSGLEQEAADDIYVEGAARLLSADHAPDLPRADSLMRALERRANLLEVLRSTLDERSVFMWIGGENPAPELRSVSMIGANYGLGYRNLGAVGVVGPLRMDYATAIASVREAAGELSRFFESVYEQRR